MNHFSRLLIFLFGSLAMAFNVFSNVDPKNANAYYSWSDLSLKGGKEDLIIDRVYNSKSPYRGIFGFGYGTKWETKLTISNDGTVTVHENGSGADTIFSPSTPVNAEAAAEKIVAVMATKVPRLDQAEWKKKLAENKYLRDTYARRYNIKSEIANGTELVSNQRGSQKIVKNSNGYVRSFENGRNQYFSNDGKFMKETLPGGYSVNLSYKGKFLHNIKDSQARQIFFEFYADGKVKNLWTGNGKKKAAYVYKGDELIKSTDVAGNTYEYTYDAGGFHNLTQIKFSNGETIDITYEPKTFFVSSVKERNGELTEYKWENDKSNPEMHYWTIITKKDAQGKVVENYRYEYENKRGPDGRHYTYKTIENNNGIVTETIYNDCCQAPLQIKRGNLVTTFKYDGPRLIEKSSNNGQFVKLKYDNKWKKISHIENSDGWIKYDYDNKGNLQMATSKSGMAVKLIYNGKGQIQSISDKGSKSKRRTLYFSDYNVHDKPQVIKMDQVGTINVKYNNAGEIQSVKSKTGDKMARQVTEAFRNLMSLIRPASVPLTL